MTKNRFIFNDMPEDDLLWEMKGGNEDAFVVIYKKYHPVLYVLAHKYLKDDDSARNIVQSVFIKFWEVRSNLYTMAKNLILNEISNRAGHPKSYFSPYNNKNLKDGEK